MFEMYVLINKLYDLVIELHFRRFCRFINYSPQGHFLPKKSITLAANTFKMDAQKFANTWIECWNSHNLDNILAHYADDIEITTPMIKLAAGIESGSLKGKDLVRDYWQKALIKIPDLHFELLDVTEGINSVALYYKSVMNKKAIEVMFFNAEGKVNKMYALYT